MESEIKPIEKETEEHQLCVGREENQTRSFGLRRNKKKKKITQSDDLKAIAL